MVRGAKGLISKRRWKLDSFRPTPGDYMTCTAMFGNGPVLSMTRVMVGANNAAQKSVRAVAGCCGAVRGTTNRSGCAGLDAASGSHSTGAPAGVFAWPGLFTRLRG